MAKRPKLVTQYLEKIHRDVFEEHPDLVRELVRGRNGIYALYRKDELYYVGLAKDLRFRVKAHLKDRHPIYKEWIFFDKLKSETNPPNLYFEHFTTTSWPIERQHNGNHAMLRGAKPECLELFNLYIEVATDRNKKASHTETIEDALRQAVKGQTGFMGKEIHSQGSCTFTAIPVVVTTASLYEADFDIKKVSLQTGKIEPENLKLKPLEFCAVNYHPDDALSINSDYSRKSTGFEYDYIWLQTRTVFVVQSESILKFLKWLPF